MAGLVDPFRGAAVVAFVALAAAVVMVLSNAATAGAACNQVCAAGFNTFFGDTAGDGNTGPANSAFGFQAGDGNTGGFNSAFGFLALSTSNSGNNNTSTGFSALKANTTGQANTATGADVLEVNTTGSQNTASGALALELNTMGNNNTANGVSALQSNTTGNNNTANGFNALSSNTANNNTATGANAMFSNTTGSKNTASGVSALRNNTAGFNNTASGFQALLNDTTGFRNTGIGVNALFHNTTGNENIGLGYNAGFSLTGNNNIDIGNFVQGRAGESNTIRIGAQDTQTATFIAGIKGTAVIGADVVVSSSTGQIGVIASSARYKKDIKQMGATSDGLIKLRPVTFRYRNDEQGTTQYGLVAEEVEKVYPELVTYGADGKVETVRYSMLTSMLLNEVQKQQRQKQELTAQVAALKASEARHEQELKEMRAAFEGRLSTIEHAMRTRDGSRTLATALDK